MRGGGVIKRARSRSGLSDGELADHLAVGAATIAAWEAADPPFSIVERVVEACRMDLSQVLAEPDPDPHNVSLLEESLRGALLDRLRRSGR